MTKSEITQEVQRAKIAHKRWVKRADHLISGLPIEKDFIPLDATSCGFGVWLYSQGTQLRSLEATQYIIEEIECLHDEVHNGYGRIYNLYFIVPQNRSILSKVLTFNSKAIKPDEIEEAKKYFKLLEKSSNELSMLLDKLVEVVTHIPNEKITQR